MREITTGVVFLALLGGLGAFHYYDKGIAVGNERKAVTARLNKLYQDKLDEAAEKTRKTQFSINEQHAKEEEVKSGKIKALDTQLANALSKLRERPTRPTDRPITPTVGKTCTGAELYKEDGEFLTGEAFRAERLIVDRDFYYNEYENARQALEGLKH